MYKTELCWCYKVTWKENRLLYLVECMIGMTRQVESRRWIGLGSAQVVRNPPAHSPATQRLWSRQSRVDVLNTRYLVLNLSPLRKPETRSPKWWTRPQMRQEFKSILHSLLVHYGKARKRAMMQSLSVECRNRKCDTTNTLPYPRCTVNDWKSPPLHSAASIPNYCV